MFFSLRNYILSDVNLSDRNNFGEIVKILFGNARFMIFFAVIFCLCVLFLIIGIIRINKNASEFLVYVIAVILLYELFILKRIYKATNFDDRTVKRKDNFKEFFTDFLVGRSFKSKLAEKNELTNENEEELNNLKGINDFRFDESDKEEEKSKTYLENLEDEKESKEKNNSKKEKDDFKKDINKPKKDNNKITKEKEDKADTKNGSIILVTKENSKKPESIIQKQPISSEDSENFKKTDKITNKDILKKTDHKSEIKKEEEKLNEPEKEILKKITGNPERKEKIKILKIKVKDKKDEENKNEKEPEKYKNEEETEENKNIKEPEEKKEEKRENRKEEENKKMPKVKLNKTEGDIYLTKIKQNINLKNDALNKVTLLRENLDAARSQVSTMVKELRTNFFNLLAVSDKIEHILLSIGIPLSIQKYELEELENEINNKFTLEDIGLEIVKDEIKNKEGHKKVKFTLLKSNPNEKIIESLEKIKNRIRINDEPINIEQNLSFIESILVLEAIISLIFLIVLIFDFSDYVKYFRFVILIILILNVFIGVYILIISELLNKKCLMKEKEGCKQNIHKVNELVMLLNKNASFEEDQIEVIKNEFDKISSKTEKNIEALENYLKNIFRSKLGVKIFIFENLIDKLRFIEGDFEELMKNSVDKKLFYTNVDLLARSLEKIKNFLKNTNTYKVIDVYKDLVIVNSFFKNERDSVNENVKRIIKLDLQKENKYKTKTCETFIKKICNFSELIDEVSFILIFCSFLLLVLVLI